MEMAMGLFQGLGLAAPAAAPVVGAVGAPVVQGVTSGLTFAKLLSGGATVFSMINEINAGKADAEQATLAAEDAAREQPLETLQGIKRRTSIRAEMMQRLGDLDTAYAASGTDLSFGTPTRARQEAFRAADTAITTDVGTEMTRQARLVEREANYRKIAKRAKSRGVLSAIETGGMGASRLAGIGG